MARLLLRLVFALQLSGFAAAELSSSGHSTRSQGKTVSLPFKLRLRARRANIEDQIGLAEDDLVSLQVRDGDALEARQEDVEPFGSYIQNFIAGQQYAIGLGVGTSPQPIDLFIDTGSSDTWMFAPNTCRSTRRTGPCVGGEFNSAESSSFKDIATRLGRFRGSYGDGSQVYGDFFQDDIVVGGANVSQLTMGLVDRITGILRQGILGLGMSSNEYRVNRGQASYPNLPDVMKTQGLTETRSFSVYLDGLADEGGALLFGGYDTAKFSGQIVMFPIQTNPIGIGKSAYYIPLTQFGASYGGSTYLYSTNHDPYPIATLLDSGTSGILLPLAFFTPFIQLFNLRPIQRGPRGVFGTYLVDCDRVERFGSGSVAFFFGSSRGGIPILVPFEELIVPFYDPETGSQVEIGGVPLCRFGIQASPPGLPVILGQPFMRSAFIMYDIDNKLVGVAQAKYDKDNSNVIEYTGRGDGKIVTDSSAPTAVPINYRSPAYYNNQPSTPNIISQQSPVSVPYPEDTTPASSVDATPTVGYGPLSGDSTRVKLARIPRSTWTFLVAIMSSIALGSFGIL